MYLPTWLFCPQFLLLLLFLVGVVVVNIHLIEMCHKWWVEYALQLTLQFIIIHNIYVASGWV